MWNHLLMGVGLKLQISFGPWRWLNHPTKLLKSTCRCIWTPHPLLEKVDIFSLVDKEFFNNSNLYEAPINSETSFLKFSFDVLFRLAAFWLTGTLTEPSNVVAGIDLLLFLDASLSTSKGRYFFFRKRSFEQYQSVKALFNSAFSCFSCIWCVIQVGCLMTDWDVDWTA